VSEYKYESLIIRSPWPRGIYGHGKIKQKIEGKKTSEKEI